MGQQSAFFRSCTAAASHVCPQPSPIKALKVVSSGDQPLSSTQPRVQHRALSVLAHNWPQQAAAMASDTRGMSHVVPVLSCAKFGQNAEVHSCQCALLLLARLTQPRLSAFLAHQLCLGNGPLAGQAPHIGCTREVQARTSLTCASPSAALLTCTLSRVVESPAQPEGLTFVEASQPGL